MAVAIDHSQSAAADRHHLFQGRRLALEVEVFGIRQEALAVLFRDREDPNDLPGIGHRKRPEPQSIDQTEDRGVRADAQTERKGGHQREQGLGGERAECKAYGGERAECKAYITQHNHLDGSESLWC